MERFQTKLQDLIVCLWLTCERRQGKALTHLQKQQWHLDLSTT